MIRTIQARKYGTVSSGIILAVLFAIFALVINTLETWISSWEVKPGKAAPVTVKNFLQYVEEGFYDGTIFHRVISGFMIQGGGFIAVGNKKTAGLHAFIVNEAAGSIKNERGTISMARTGDPNSATSQFFINVVDNAMLDARPGSAGYCAFGRVVDGMDVVDTIKNVGTTTNPMNPREKSLPLNPPVIYRISRVGN